MGKNILSNLPHPFHVLLLQKQPSNTIVMVTTTFLERLLKKISVKECLISKSKGKFWHEKHSFVWYVEK